MNHAVTDELRRTPSVYFITGTDTGVGKTIATCRLVQYLNSHDVDAMAVKPFCSGGLDDLLMLSDANGRNQSVADINLYTYAPPLCPHAACIEHRLPFPEKDRTLEFIRRAAAQTRVLLVEGAGGILAPIAPDFSFADLAFELASGVIVVVPDRLGCLNHALLTRHYLEARAPEMPVSLLINRFFARDPSANTNATLLQAVFGPENTAFLHEIAPNQPTHDKGEKKFEKSLAGNSDFDRLFFAPRNGGGRTRQ